MVLGLDPRYQKADLKKHHVLSYHYCLHQPQILSLQIALKDMLHRWD
jgi:hypothetical protein